MKGAEPHAVQRSLPPTWGRIGGGVDERPGITKRPGLYLPWRSTMHALIPFLLLAAPAVPADRPSASARVTGVTAVTRADALGRSAGTAGAARSRKGIKACMVDLQGRYRPGLLVIPGRSSTPPPILPHVGGRERCTACGSAPFIDPPSYPPPRRGEETLHRVWLRSFHRPPLLSSPTSGGGNAAPRVAPLLSSTPPPILPHVGGRERCTADGSAPLRRSAGGVTSSAMAGRIDVNADL